MIIREKYMMLSHQSFPFTVAKYLDKVFNDEKNNERKNTSCFNDSDHKQCEFIEEAYGN